MSLATMLWILGFALLPTRSIIDTARAARDMAPVLAIANDNTQDAGILRGNTLTLSLVAQQVRWHPEAADGPHLDVEAFSEEGKAPLIPGPLVRVRAGTRVETRIRNALPDTLLVFGLGGASGQQDTVRIAPGATEDANVTAGAPGTYGYGGATIVGDSVHQLGTGNQLLGALIVDGATPHRDRVFVISVWPPLPGRFIVAINGKSWPHTERMDMSVGDSVHWRVINGTRGRHPMHLHGFYFRIDSRGSWSADTAMKGVRPVVVTESVPLRGTYTMTWTAERAGNWLFHCHDALHTSWRRRANLRGERPGAPPVHDGAHHAEEDMSGLIIGIRVHQKAGRVVRAAVGGEPQRRVRLTVNEKAGLYGGEPGFSYVESNGADPARDSMAIPARPLVLVRGERAEITVVNRLSIATAVHWHGIELDSYYDGVGGWSGDSVRKAPVIAPGDSFVVRFTPPRAGTFIFHAHADDMRQMALGLYGALIVLPPREAWNPARDHVVLVSQLGRGPTAKVGVNGSASPEPITLTAGVTHRLRFINVSVADDATFELRADTSAGTSAVQWRALAKDGADLHASHAIQGRAKLFITPGETYDFEVALPRGDYTLRMASINVVSLAIRVR